MSSWFELNFPQTFTWILLWILTCSQLLGICYPNQCIIILHRNWITITHRVTAQCTRVPLQLVCWEGADWLGWGWICTASVRRTRTSEWFANLFLVLYLWPTGGEAWNWGIFEMKGSRSFGACADIVGGCDWGILWRSVVVGNYLRNCWFVYIWNGCNICYN